MYVDFSAIAKGYGVDLVGEFLESKGITDYMVEIGGEVRAAGSNPKGEPWIIGIEDPVVAQEERKLLATVRLKNRSMATSGNYRNYYEENGRIIAHTIDPKTGFSCKNDLLSASVFAPDCMTADAFATAFMVLGVERSKEILANANLDAFLIFYENGKIKTYASEGIVADLDETIDHE
jgi:thiamine biosynthesis lipoprotein